MNAATSITLGANVSGTIVNATTNAATVTGTNTGGINITMAGATGAKTITLGAGNDVIVTGAAADVIAAGNGNNSITGAEGADTMSGGTGVDTYAYGSIATLAAQTGITLATADNITGFATGVDKIKTGTAGAAGNFSAAGAAAASFAAAEIAANVVFAGGTEVYYYAHTAADGGLLFVDTAAGAVATAVIRLVGLGAGGVVAADIIA